MAKRPSPRAARSGRLTLGIDVGGTAIKLGLLAEDDRLVAEHEIATPLDRSPRDAVARIAGAVEALDAQQPIAAVGVGCAGLIDMQRGVVLLSPNLPAWRDLPLGPWLEEDLGQPVAVLNDANAFALAETRVGAGRGQSPVVALTIGTGIGGAVLYEGQFAAGRHGFSGEVGHMSIAWDGPRCSCGNRGCLELYVGRRPIETAYRTASAGSADQAGNAAADGRWAAVTPRLIAAAAARGDPLARQVYARAGEQLGTALANLQNLIDPARFVIGGGIAQAGDLLLAPARATLAARAMAGPARVATVCQATLGTRAGIIGAAMHGRDRCLARDEP